MSEVSTGSELRRWYWLKTELAEMARRAGVSAAGSKQQLADRVAAVLDGEPLPAALPRRQQPTGRQLEGQLTMDTVIPVGQRCSQTLRAFFTTQIGAGFTFDAAMRAFIAQRAGSTLGDAATHWHTTRSSGLTEIGGQFELNRFTRQWYIDHPGATRTELQQAWAAYRTTPIDKRDRA